MIHLCQFHVVQAILRWDSDDGKAAKNPRISFAIKYHILLIFRVMQRCRTWEDWPAARDQFLKEVHAIIFSQGVTIQEDEDESPASSNEGTGGERDICPPVQKPKKKKMPVCKSKQDMCLQWDFLEHYFHDNWFTEIWICRYLFIMATSD